MFCLHYGFLSPPPSHPSWKVGSGSQQGSCSTCMVKPFFYWTGCRFFFFWQWTVSLLFLDSNSHYLGLHPIRHIADPTCFTTKGSFGYLYPLPQSQVLKDFVVVVHKTVTFVHLFYNQGHIQLLICLLSAWSNIWWWYTSETNLVSWVVSTAWLWVV